jgi:hypothetical protein
MRVARGSAALTAFACAAINLWQGGVLGSVDDAYGLWKLPEEALLARSDAHGTLSEMITVQTLMPPAWLSELFKTGLVAKA